MLRPLKGHWREIIKAYPKVNKDGSGRHAEPLAQRLLTCPHAIIQSVFQPEAWRWKQNVDPNNSYLVYVNVTFPNNSWIIHPLNLFKFGQICFLEERAACKSNFKLLQAVRLFIMSDSFLWQQSILLHMAKCLYKVVCLISVLNIWVYFRLLSNCLAMKNSPRGAAVI